MGLSGASLWKRLAWICCLVAPLACAQPVPVETDLYQEALQLLEKGDKQGAIERYNRLLENLPNHAGAWLDLGLLYCEHGDIERAHFIFDQIEARFAPPPAIREVIRHYRSEGCVAAPVPAGRWTLSLGGGYTDNVNRGLSNPVIDLSLPLGAASVRLGDTYLPQASALTALSASYSRNLKVLRGTQWFAGVTQKIFPSRHEFNQRSMLMGLSKQRAIGGWLQELELVTTHFALNERTHQTGLLVQAGLWLPSMEGRLPRVGAEVSASRWRYANDPLYDSTVLEGRISGRWAPMERLVLRATAGPLVDKADRDRPGLDRRGYSLNLISHWAVSERIRFDAIFRRRLLQDDAVYSPLFGNQKHRSLQQQLLLALQSKKNATAPTTWRLELERAQSRDNIPLFPYTSHTLTLSWQYQWDVF